MKKDFMKSFSKKSSLAKQKTAPALKKALAGTLIAAAALTAIYPATLGHTEMAGAAQYQNEVFTKALYKKTVKIGFGAKSCVVKDKKTVKKAYELLSGMALTQAAKKGNFNNAEKITLYLKNGKTKNYSLTEKSLTNGKKTYTIVKNNPLDKLREIFKAKAPSDSDVNNHNRIAAASYPKTAPYPEEADFTKKNGEVDYDKYNEAYSKWWEDIRARRNITGYADNLDGFLTKSCAQFLSSKDDENRVYSPLNVYMALGMLAELTDGNSRQQILDLLGSKDIASLRKQASDMWNAQYRNDKTVKSILASSLWMNNSVNFVQPTLDILAKNYYASSYQGEMGSDQLNEALQGWLNEQTGGLLKKQASNVKLRPNTVMALATTLYYRAKWHDEFSSLNTKEETFHTASAGVTCDFMHKDKTSSTFYKGEKFSAVSESLSQSGSMWFLLPDKGVTVEELLKDDQAMAFLTSRDRNELVEHKDCLVNLSVPKFDASSQFDLCDGLKALGVTDVFDGDISDFSPMTRDPYPIYLSTADHAGRVKIDEKGVTAAAYTVMSMDAGAAMPPDEIIDFILDRPFLFAVTGNDELPLFVGVVKQP